MPWVDVQFRVLQVARSRLVDERVTVALVHWDGADLRFAWGPGRIPRELESRGDVERGLRAVRRRVSGVAAGGKQLDFGIDAVFPVSEGQGSLVSWSQVYAGRVSDSLAHFLDVAAELDLVPVPSGSMPSHADNDRGAKPRLADRLARLGGELRTVVAEPDRIDVRRHVQGLRDYESPLSWKNTKWRHSFPVILSHSTPSRIVERFEAALGRLDTSVPPGEIGVVLAVHPSDLDFVEEIDRVRDFLASKLGERVECVGLPIVRRVPDLTGLETRIRCDVANVH